MIEIALGILTHGLAFWVGFFVACALAAAGRYDDAVDEVGALDAPLLPPPRRRR